MRRCCRAGRHRPHSGRSGRPAPVPADFALRTGTKMLPVLGVAGVKEPRAAAANTADEPSQVRHSARLTPVTAIIAVATLLALGLRLYQLGRPGYLLSVTEYDDGPYFGSAVRLVNGSIPYRDFLVVQPPGITLLMTPAALLGKVTGTDWAIAVGRLLTAFASVACVTLTGLLARHRGVLAAVVACGIAAVFPDSVQAAHTRSEERRVGKECRSRWS